MTDEPIGQAQIAPKEPVPGVTPDYYDPNASLGAYGPDVTAGASDLDGAMWDPGRTVNTPREGPGVHTTHATPPQYIGPLVRDQAPLLNPSAGYQGGSEGAGKYGVGGVQQYDDAYNPVGADLNPQGPLVDGSVADQVRAARG